MIERNLSLFGLVILLFGSPATLWAVMQENDSSSLWIAFFPPFIGLTLILIDYKQRGALTRSKDLFIRLTMSTMLIVVGVAMSVWGENLTIRGTTLPFGWLVMAFGAIGAAISFSSRRKSP